MVGDIEKGYDLTSVAQAEATVESINQDPFDRQILEMFAAKLAPCSGLLCDLGCGPGQVARFFHDRGYQVVGIDLSAGMLREARKFHPGIRFAKANMKKLPFKDGELAGIIGFLSLCHIPRWEIPSVLAELRRTLRPSGLLLLAFHLGRGTFFRAESWGKPVSLQTTLLQSLEFQDYLRAAGFQVIGAMERQDPKGPRGYLLALRPCDASRVISSLREAVLTGTAKDVDALLIKGISPDTLLDGYTALHLAAGDGRLQVIKLLLRAGASVDMPCSAGGTALYVAIQMGQFAAARRLTEAGADPAFTDNQGNTLLHLACNHGRIDIVKWLLQLGVDPQAKNQQEETPATWAARAGFEKLAAMLGWVNNDPKDSGVAQAGQALCDCSYGSCLPIELR
jgi:ankyrin repeat protein/ubiquinone/menaquinone biosynthesis C-methylase UbiE